MTRLAPIMQGFFTGHLMTHRRASPHTVASYRDTFKLVLAYAHQRTGKLPAQLEVADLDAAFIGAFLNHLETERGNSVTTRNARLTAIRALFRYASLQVPEHTALIARVLAIPAKRNDTTIVNFLTQQEVDAVIAAIDTSTWHGRRDHALLVRQFHRNRNDPGCRRARHCALHRRRHQLHPTALIAAQGQ